MSGERDSGEDHRSSSSVASLRASATSPRAALALLAALIVLRAALLVPATADILAGRSGVDLSARRAELEWVRHGVDPHLALDRVRAERGDRPFFEETVELEELSVGAFEDGDFGRVNPGLAPYPSWSYPLLAPFVWPPWPATRIYFTVLSLVCLLGFLWWTSRLLEGPWRLAAVFVCLLPAASWAVGISVGQVHALLMLTLALLASALARDRALAAGLLLGLAAVKPTTGALFGWTLLSPWLARRVGLGWALRAAAMAALLVLGSAGLVWARTGVDPLSWIRRLLRSARGIPGEGWGVLPTVARSLPDLPQVAPVVAVAGMLVAPVALWLTRSSSLLVQLAVVGVIARLWTYHRHYDDVLVLFLLLALLVELRRGSLLSLGALVSVAMTVAAPTPSSDAMALWRVGVWLTATAVLLLEAGRATRPLAAGRGTDLAALVDGPRLQEVAAESRSSPGHAGHPGHPGHRSADGRRGSLPA